jgi:inorganic pyrophosphatase
MIAERAARTQAIEMHPLHDVAIGDRIEERFPTIIEIPKGSKNKYELHKETGLLVLDRVLFSAVHYPANYGFVPQTHYDDGDPLDVLVLGQEPVHPLTIVWARAIGMLSMRDDPAASETSASGLRLDDKIVAVSVFDPAFVEYRHIDDLPKHTTAELKRFFEDYKVLENKKVVVDRFAGPDEANAAIRRGVEGYRRLRTSSAH